MILKEYNKILDFIKKYPKWCGHIFYFVILILGISLSIATKNIVILKISSILTGLAFMYIGAMSVCIIFGLTGVLLDLSYRYLFNPVINFIINKTKTNK